MKPFSQSEPGRPRALRIASTLLLLLAFVIGSGLRLAGVGPAFLFGDELHSLFALPQGYGHLMTHFSATGSGLGLPLLQRTFVDLFGHNHWAIRAPAWIPGLLLLPAAWWITRRWLGDGIAIGTTWLVATSPLLIFYSRFARSYALVALLTFVLLDQVQAAVSDARFSRGRFVGLVVLAALIPFVHPTALGSVVPILLAGAGAIALGNAQNESLKLQRAAGLIGVLPVAGAICLALHWPARESLIDFVNAKTIQLYSGAFGPLDIARLATGNDTLTIGLGGLALIGAVAIMGRYTWQAAPIVAAAVGPLLVISIVQPYGDAYAYGRYVIAALPPLFVIVASGIEWISALFWSRPGRWTGPIAAGLAMLVLISGPLPTFLGPTPQHANTYLGLRDLPRFNEPWPGIPAFYTSLPQAEGQPPTLLEVPALTTRTRHLYRLYQRIHGGQTLLGPLPGEFPTIPAGPYLAPTTVGRQHASLVDYVVVHRNVSREIARYWDWVYASESGLSEASADEAFMARHAQYGGLLPNPSPLLWAGLEQRLGAPVYQDDDVVVFRVAEPLAH